MSRADIPKVPHTLLLADDSVTIQRVIELTFADEDVNVVAVSDGEQAIARLDAQPPDIVLADVGMPGRNGYEVAQYIKGSPRLSHIPVVLLTGAFEPVDQARAAEAKCDGVLAKPFEPQLVIGRVKELLGQTKGESDTGASPIEAPPPADAAPAPATDAVSKPETADLANYFDRLDAAFGSGPAAFGTDASGSTASVPPEIDWFGATPSGSQADAPLRVVEQIAAADSVPDTPLSYASPAAAFGTADAASPNAPAWPAAATFAMGALPAGHPALEPETGAFAASPLRRGEPDAPQALDAPKAQEAPEALEAPETPRLPAAPVSLPPLADAFAALLAAEQGDLAPNVAWPAAASTTATQATDAIAEQVTQRVLDAIGPRIDASVRAAVADLVSQLAERLIREEIERIKGAIK